MDTAVMRNLVVEVDSNPQPPAPPAKAVQRTYPGAPLSDNYFELERLPASHGGHASEPASPAPETDDLEMSRPPSPSATAGDVAGIMPSMWDPYMNRYRVLAVCLANLCGALNDSAPGALIPFMEK